MARVAFAAVRNRGTGLRVAGPRPIATAIREYYWPLRMRHSRQSSAGSHWPSTLLVLRVVMK